jgi:hypothetical protein
MKALYERYIIALFRIKFLVKSIIRSGYSPEFESYNIQQRSGKIDYDQFEFIARWAGVIMGRCAICW